MRRFLLASLAIGVLLANHADAAITYSYSGTGYNLTVNPELGTDNRPSYVLATSNGNIDSPTPLDITINGDFAGPRPFLSGGMGTPPATFDVPSQLSASTASLSFLHNIGPNSLVASSTRTATLAGSDYASQDTSFAVDGYSYFAFIPDVTGDYQVDFSAVSTFLSSNPNDNGYFYTGGSANVQLVDQGTGTTVLSLQTPPQDYGFIDFTDTFNASQVLTLAAGTTYQLNFGGNIYVGGGGVGVTNTTTFLSNASITPVVAIPEPSSIAALGIFAVAGLVIRTRRNKAIVAG